jgi:hypothetical protein
LKTIITRIPLILVVTYHIEFTELGLIETYVPILKSDSSLLVDDNPLRNKLSKHCMLEGFPKK